MESHVLIGNPRNVLFCREFGVKYQICSLSFPRLDSCCLPVLTDAFFVSDKHDMAMQYIILFVTRKI